MVVSCLTYVTLKPPIRDGIHHYYNFRKAKGIDPVELGTALSCFTQLRELALEDFGSHNKLKECRRFLQLFIDHLSLPKLEVLRLTNVDLESKDAIKLVQMLSATIKEVHFDTVDFFSCYGEKRRRQPPENR
jgi:hypothetical protein